MLARNSGVERQGLPLVYLGNEHSNLLLSKVKLKNNIIWPFHLLLSKAVWLLFLWRMCMVLGPIQFQVFFLLGCFGMPFRAWFWDVMCCEGCGVQLVCLHVKARTLQVVMCVGCTPWEGMYYFGYILFPTNIFYALQKKKNTQVFKTLSIYNEPLKCTLKFS